MSYTIRPERKEDYREVENHVETCVLLSKETCKPKEVVSIKVDLDGIKDRF